MPRQSEMIGFYKARKKTGTLKWESEWKAMLKNIVTRRA